MIKAKSNVGTFGLYSMTFNGYMMIIILINNPSVPETPIIIIIATVLSPLSGVICGSSFSIVLTIIIM